MKVFNLIVFFSCIIAVHGVCQRARIRKAWEDMSTTEKTVYKEALELGMRGGFHILFTELHLHNRNGIEAHDTCGFILWHRRYLLAYENMLRSFGTKYECVTIPYWNYFNEHARATAGSCDNLEHCSLFLREMGGSSGQRRSVDIYGSSISGNCVTRSPAGAFCQARDNRNCVRCIPRGDWTQEWYPTEASYASLLSAMRRSSTYQQANTNFQEGVHNVMHGIAGSTMGTFASPADPIFFSHHATIDMLHYMYFNCRWGTRTMTNTQKQSNTIAFQKCQSWDWSGSPSSTTDVGMFINNGRGRDVHAHNFAKLRPFFVNTGRKYWHLVDADDISGGSYAYNVNTIRSTLTRMGLTCNPAGGNRRKLRIQHSKLPAENEKYLEWAADAQKTARTMTRTGVDAARQLEYVECLEFNLRHGVKDYTPQFKHDFRIHSARRCFQLLRDIGKGKRMLVIPEWKDKFDKVFGKPHNRR